MIGSILVVFPAGVFEYLHPCGKDRLFLPRCTIDKASVILAPLPGPAGFGQVYNSHGTGCRRFGSLEVACKSGRLIIEFQWLK